MVPLHVESQMVRAGEAPAAGYALEGLGARVLPIVPGQLVGAGKAPVAAFPRAFIGLLTCGEEPQVTGTVQPRCRSTAYVDTQLPGLPNTQPTLSEMPVLLGRPWRAPRAVPLQNRAHGHAGALHDQGALAVHHP